MISFYASLLRDQLICIVYLTGCNPLIIEVLDPCEFSHVTTSLRSSVVELDWLLLLMIKLRSQAQFPWREWKATHLNPWACRVRLTVAEPLHYPRKLARAVRIVD